MMQTQSDETGLFSACYKPKLEPMSSKTEGYALLFVLNPQICPANVKYTQEGSYFMHMVWVFYGTGNWTFNYHSWWLGFLHRIRAKSLIGYELSSKVRKVCLNEDLRCSNFVAIFNLNTVTWISDNLLRSKSLSETKLMNRKTYTLQSLSL